MLKTIVLYVFISILLGLGSTMDPDGRGSEFRSICQQVFDLTTNRFTPQQVKENLDRANELLLRPNRVNIHWQLFAMQVRSLVEISSNESCTESFLEKRQDLEAFYANHPNIGPFVTFYNKQAFTRCARELNERVSAAYERDLANTHLGRTVELIRQARPSRDNLGLDLSIISRAMMTYLRQLSYRIRKSHRISMNDHNGRIIEVLEQVYTDDCANLLGDYERDHELADMYLSYDAELYDLFDVNFHKLLDQIFICQELDTNKQYIYPLGAYDSFQTIYDTIMSPDERSDLLVPERMRDLIETALYVSQAELISGIQINDFSNNQLIEYLTISQIDRAKCDEARYLRGLATIRGQNELNPNVHHYLEHYIHLQLSECLDDVSEAIEQAVSSLNEIDQVTIEQMHNLLQQAVTESPGANDVRLYMQVPFEHFSVAMERFMNHYGFDVRNGLAQPDLLNLDLSTVAPATSNLILGCRNLINSILDLARQFYSIIQLDSPQQNVLDQRTRKWMESYKMCQIIAALSVSH